MDALLRRAVSAEAEVRALREQLAAAHELVRASGALLCDYREERGMWWDGFREALAGLRSSLGLTSDLTDTDLRAATADPTCKWCGSTIHLHSQRGWLHGPTPAHGFRDESRSTCCNGTHRAEPAATADPTPPQETP